MKYIGVGLCIVVIALCVGVYVQKNGAASLERALEKESRSISSAANSNASSLKLDGLSLIATSVLDASAVVKSRSGEISIVKEKDFIESEGVVIEKVSEQSLMYRRLNGGDLTVMYLAGSKKANLNVSGLASIQSTPASSVVIKPSN